MGASSPLYASTASLSDSGVTFHLSEVKGPVMDRLEGTEFLRHLTGKVFLTQYEAIATLDPETAHLAEARTPRKQTQSGYWIGPQI